MDQHQEKYQRLQKELQPYEHLLAKAADAILDQEVSSYPIFVVYSKPIELGIPILDQPEGSSKPSISMSTLEELATKKIVGMDKVDAFREVFKDPLDYYCLFVVEDDGAAFIFLPRDSDA